MKTTTTKTSNQVNILPPCMFFGANGHICSLSAGCQWSSVAQMLLDNLACVLACVCACVIQQQSRLCKHALWCFSCMEMPFKSKLSMLWSNCPQLPPIFCRQRAQRDASIPSSLHPFLSCQPWAFRFMFTTANVFRKIRCARTWTLATLAECPYPPTHTHTHSSPGCGLMQADS